MTLMCNLCLQPVNLAARGARAWQNSGLPFVCDRCLAMEIAKAALASQIAKAEADTRAFQTINLNPAIHETRTNPTQRPRP